MYMTTKVLNIYEIKSKFSEYAKQVLKGKSFIIAIRNKPFAKIVPLVDEKSQKKQMIFKEEVSTDKKKHNPIPGSARGSVKINGDLTEEFIPEGLWEMYR